MEARISTERHVQRQRNLKGTGRDTASRRTIEKKGILIVFTGNGQREITAAFCTVTRAVGHGQNGGVAQYIKGQWTTANTTFSSRCGLSFHYWEPVLPWDTEPAKRYSTRQRGLVEKQRMLADKRYD
ncbi:cob(I)yrinic acid a,c-diamide adenosyltransferase [Escherichia coli]|nr:cob(I)yrinic acid a,c-diamide adenosyltransferase [Escherichia coli]